MHKSDLETEVEFLSGEVLQLRIMLNKVTQIMKSHTKRQAKLSSAKAVKEREHQEKIIALQPQRKHNRYDKSFSPGLRSKEEDLDFYNHLLLLGMEAYRDGRPTAAHQHRRGIERDVSSRSKRQAAEHAQRRHHRAEAISPRPRHSRDKSKPRTTLSSPGHSGERRHRKGEGRHHHPHTKERPFNDFSSSTTFSSTTYRSLDSDESTSSSTSSSSSWSSEEKDSRSSREAHKRGKPHRQTRSKEPAKKSVKPIKKETKLASTAKQQSSRKNVEQTASTASPRDSIETRPYSEKSGSSLLIHSGTFDVCAAPSSYTKPTKTGEEQKAGSPEKEKTQHRVGQPSALTVQPATSPLPKAAASMKPTGESTELSPPPAPLRKLPTPGNMRLVESSSSSGSSSSEELFPPMRSSKEAMNILKAPTNMAGVRAPPPTTTTETTSAHAKLQTLKFSFASSESSSSTKASTYSISAEFDKVMGNVTEPLAETGYYPASLESVNNPPAVVPSPSPEPHSPTLDSSAFEPLSKNSATEPFIPPPSTSGAAGATPPADMNFSEARELYSAVLSSSNFQSEQPGGEAASVSASLPPPSQRNDRKEKKAQPKKNALTAGGREALTAKEVVSPTNNAPSRRFQSRGEAVHRTSRESPKETPPSKESSSKQGNFLTNDIIESMEKPMEDGSSHEFSRNSDDIRKNFYCGVAY